MKSILYRYRHAWVFTYFIIYLPWYFGLQLRDISFHDQKINESAGNYCTSIIVKGGFRTRTVKLEEETGSCTVTAS